MTDEAHGIDIQDTFFGGGLRHQISVFVGCVTGMGCGCVGTVRGIALFENVSFFLSFFFFLILS